MSCHVRTVECSSEALAIVRWAHAEGLSPWHSPSRARTAMAPCPGSWVTNAAVVISTLNV
jgi:hypothetical protein